MCSGVRCRVTEKNISDSEQASREADRADRSLFIQELLLALMSDSSDSAQTGVSNEPEFWSSVEDVVLSSDGLLSETVDSSTSSSQIRSTSSLPGVCDALDSALVAKSRVAEPIGRESFGVSVGNCGAAGAGLEVACSSASVL